ncbi:MAG: hypothetical protein NNA22_05545 [Nitrospira sp.]|nr:hypothetical protein [Nitrospira sp.]
MEARLWMMIVGSLALLSAGCATTGQDGMSVQGHGSLTSIYSILDTTALVYSDPAAGSPINDHPLRWVGFLGHPFGHAVDYGINRPLYVLGASSPYLFGYTAEDAMEHSQRR